MDKFTSFNYFKKFCTNADEIIKKEGLTDENYEDFLRDKVTYPVCDGPFRMVKATEINHLADKDSYTPIDEGIVDAIILLNQNGYYTDWCCEGHAEDDYEGYIAFTNGRNGRTINDEKMHFLIMNLVSLAFTGAYISMEMGASFIIRFNLGHHPDKEAHKKSMEALMGIIEQMIMFGDGDLD